MNNLNETLIVKAIKDQVPEIKECNYEREAVKNDHIGYIIANVEHLHIKKIVVTKDFIFHLIMVNKFLDINIALYEVYLNI